MGKRGQFSMRRGSSVRYRGAKKWFETDSLRRDWAPPSASLPYSAPAAGTNANAEVAEVGFGAFDATANIVNGYATPDLSWDFNNGVDGVKVDVLDTPSAGDDSFASITENTASDGHFKYSNVAPAHGALGLRVETGVTSVSCYAQWDITGSGLDIYFRTALRLPTGTTFSTRYDFWQYRDAATRTRFALNTSRQLQCVNGSTVVGTMTTALGFDTDYRVEGRMFIDASAGILELKLYVGDATTATETLTVTALNTGTTECTNVRMGNPFATPSLGPIYFDDWGISYAGYMGPVAAGAPSTNANAENASTTFTANDATPSVATNAELAAADFAALAPTPSVATQAESPSAGWVASDATGTVRSSAELASVGFGALDATVSISANAELAATDFAAFDATVQTGGSSASASAELAAIDFAALAPTPAVATSAELAIANVTALDATANVKGSAEVASVGFGALDATVAVRTDAELAAAAFSAADPAGSVQANAQVAETAFTALDATAQTGSSASASAELAATDFAALPPAVAVSSNAELAVAAFDAFSATPAVRPGAEAASAGFGALDAATSVRPSAEVATATLAAHNAAAAILARAEAASVGFGALDATVLTGKVAPAEVATVGFGAFDATVSIKPSAEFATVGWNAFDGSALTALPRSNDFTITGPVLALTTGLPTAALFVSPARGPSRVGSPSLNTAIATPRRATTTGDVFP